MMTQLLARWMATSAPALTPRPRPVLCSFTARYHQRLHGLVEERERGGTRRKTGRYPRWRAVGLLAALAVLVGAVPGPGDHSVSHEPDNPVVLPAEVEIIVTGIPGAGALCQVGTFHLGGPFPGRPEVQPGAILAPERLLIASSSNFGAPRARDDQAPGPILSIHPGGGRVDVPRNFAAAGGQASVDHGRVQLYTANSPAFLNRLNNPTAATAGEPAVSGPLGISLNNAFGRPWFANAPYGSAGDGTITVIDPDGRPFRGPHPGAGGVFMGDDTNRSPSSTHGLGAGALATSLITKSPDSSGRAVYQGTLLGLPFRAGVKTFQVRVWRELRDAWKMLDEASRAQLRRILPPAGPFGD